MRHRRALLENMKAPSNGFDVAIEWLLFCLLAFMPLAFGAVEAWSEEIVIALSGVIVICFLLNLVFSRDRHLTWTWAYVPIGLFLAIACLQLVSLPVWLVKIISPNTVILRRELLGDLPNSDTVLKSMPLSFYPHATKHGLRLVLAVTGVFIVVLNVFRRPDQIKRLLMSIAVIGGIIAVITLAQNLFGNGKIYWFVQSNHCKGYSGPFVNHSNYGQFMNLSIGAALGLLMVGLHEAFCGKKATLPIVFNYMTSKPARRLWLLAAIIGLGVATIFASLTRGGIISMLIAMAFAAVLVTSQRSLRSHGWIMVVVALIAFICVLYVGFDAVYERLASLRYFDEAEAGRMQILKDIGIVWTKFPVFGTGLGTHPVVYPMFDRSTIVPLAVHAENEYAQVVEETGSLGLSLLIVLGVIVWANYARGIRNARHPICSAVYGLGFGLLAILIHSFSDFGQHLPANCVLSAIFCALFLILARQKDNRRISDSEYEACDFKTHHSRLPVRAVVLFSVTGIWLWAFVGADNARVAEAHWDKAHRAAARLSEKTRQETEAEYEEIISHAQTALDHEPENIEYRYWLNVYRWRSIGRITEPDATEPIIPDSSMPLVYDIVDELHKARIVCPTYGPTYSVVGQIEKFVLDDDSGADKIRKGFLLAPCDPLACFVAGILDLSEGKPETCIEKFTRAVNLDAGLFSSVVNIYLHHLSRPQLAILAAGDDIGRLSHVADALDGMQYTDLAEQCREKIKALLQAKCSAPDASAQAFASLAAIYRRENDNEKAAECYQQALALDYGQVQWRLELAKLLVEIERVPEAMHEAKICLRLRPKFKPAEQLVAALSIDPAFFDEKAESP